MQVFFQQLNQAFHTLPCLVALVLLQYFLTLVTNIRVFIIGQTDNYFQKFGDAQSQGSAIKVKD
jgi:hypothetical protein